MRVRRIRFVILKLCLLVSILGVSAAVWASSENGAGSRGGHLGVAGLSDTAGDDEPRVLYILPWKPPTLPRRQRAELESAAPNLEQTLDPRVIERHRLFRNTLDPLTLSPNRDQGSM
ncbi:MAG: hypothetical protein EP339_12955 [Gammaproteobacteria bacterium]|nr:MAG: hypothetical protein EP339_12955 [Gammaproteobacteria bacterium]